MDFDDAVSMSRQAARHHVESLRLWPEDSGVELQEGQPLNMRDEVSTPSRNEGLILSCDRVTPSPALERQPRPSDAELSRMAGEHATDAYLALDRNPASTTAGLE